MNKLLIHILFIAHYVLSDSLKDILKNLNQDYLEHKDKTLQNINTETIQYGLSYDNESVVKVFIRLVEEGINNTVSFLSFLRSENGNKDYPLNCSNPGRDLIICSSEPDIVLNTDDKYYLYYNRSKGEKIIFDYEDILEDDKRISLIFKPELYVNQTVYKDNKKIMAQINKKTVGEAYLYVVNKTKKVLNLPKDRFNKYIDLNNYVFTPDLKGYQRKSVLDTYEEALRRGYRFVEAEVLFTKDMVPIVSKKKQDISSKDLEDLEKNENVLTLWDLLKKCRKKNVIVEIKFNFMDENESSKLDEYANAILKKIKQTDMFDSVFFNDNLKYKIIRKIRNLKYDICITISNVKNKNDIEKIKNKYKGANRIIYEINKDNIEKDLVDYILSLGHRVKVFTVDNTELTDKYLSWGVNYISTNNIHPFLINNEKEEPFRVKCVNIFLDDLAECKMGPEIILRDNEFYNIFYSLNIYNKSEDINETAIGEFRFEDTKINDNKYYVIKTFNFKKGVIQLITSDKVQSGKQIKGVIGPNHDNAAECYLYNFTCYGANQNLVNCDIEKDDDKIEYDGEYVIYYLENYSFNEEEIEDFNLMKLKKKHVYTKQEKITYTFIIIFVSLVFLFSSYSFQNKMNMKLYSYGDSELKGIPLVKLPKNMNIQSEYDKRALMFE
jgi:glycerophosphoryl diester phosphodiesterase